MTFELGITEYSRPARFIETLCAVFPSESTIVPSLTYPPSGMMTEQSLSSTVPSSLPSLLIAEALSVQIILTSEFTTERTSQSFCLISMAYCGSLLLQIILTLVFSILNSSLQISTATRPVSSVSTPGPVTVVLHPI